MLSRDVEPAAEVVLRGEWGDRRAFFGFAAAHAACRPIVAERDGEIVGTAIGTVNGRVGWIGSVFVAEVARGAGVGGSLTDRVIDDLEGAGCRTLVLVATDAGRPMYERRGFAVETRYRTVEAEGIATAPPRTLRAFRPTDLESMARLDRLATGEDRAHLLRAFADPASARCLVGAAGDLRGFVVRAPWGGGATIAPHLDDAVDILAARRAATGPGRRVRAGVLEGNGAGLRRLLDDGWRDAWDAPRMQRGEPLDWQPEGIWGQFNHALG